MVAVVAVVALAVAALVPLVVPLGLVALRAGVRLTENLHTTLRVAEVIRLAECAAAARAAPVLGRAGVVTGSAIGLGGDSHAGQRAPEERGGGRRRGEHSATVSSSGVHRMTFTSSGHAGPGFDSVSPLKSPTTGPMTSPASEMSAEVPGIRVMRSRDGVRGAGNGTGE